jgi:hypothetical protein
MPLAVFVAIVIVCQVNSSAQIPIQTSGLPYSRSAYPTATNAVKGHVALFPGSRYAFVDGKKIRLSNTDLLRGEAFTENGKFFVPASFAGVLLMKQFKPEPIPAGLDRRASCRERV